MMDGEKRGTLYSSPHRFSSVRPPGQNFLLCIQISLGSRKWTKARTRLQITVRCSFKDNFTKLPVIQSSSLGVKLCWPCLYSLKLLALNLRTMNSSLKHYLGFHFEPHLVTEISLVVIGFSHYIEMCCLWEL